ncbi:MAG: SCO family protein [bacterium]|nr:SCO family protein [bacterium]
MRRAATALALLVLVAGCGREELPVLGTLPPFTLTERTGSPVGSDALAGHVWIADFVFTRCPGVCPVLSQRMADLRPKLPKGDDGVRLVSITVDPVHDTPEVLQPYAERFGAGREWLFLTGSRDGVGRLLRDGFKVGFADDGPAEAPITHSERFVLVDRALQIRGYYVGTDPADLARLVADAIALTRRPG